jgi:hypothetical protein
MLGGVGAVYENSYRAGAACLQSFQLVITGERQQYNTIQGWIALKRAGITSKSYCCH